MESEPVAVAPMVTVTSGEVPFPSEPMVSQHAIASSLPCGTPPPARPINPSLPCWRAAWSRRQRGAVACGLEATAAGSLEAAAAGGLEPADLGPAAAGGLEPADLEAARGLETAAAAGLNKRTTSEKLKEAFSKFGQVTEARVVTDRISGYSRGFGFVKYASVKEAGEAIEGMDGKYLDGWVIFAEYSKPREAPQPPHH